MNKKSSITRFITSGVAVFCIASQTQGWSQEAGDSSSSFESEKSFSLSAAVTSDTFFGTYPSFSGGYNISDSLAFTTYGIFWGGGSPGDTWGNWTELGFGVSYNLTDWLSINPQVGFLGGSLLSAGAVQNSSPIAGDGWVPNLTVNLGSEKWEGQFYSGFYLPLREQDSPAGANQLEFLHYWINFGRKINDIFSAGIHHEHLLGGSSLTEDSVFNWIGPYIQFRNEEKGIFVRAAAGWDTEAGDNFWKLSVGISF
jgi:hypothetical protein